MVDVIVVGYGPAGAAAAIAAHDAGAEVLVLESGPSGGGNAVYSGGVLLDIPGDECVEHLDALCFGRTDRSVLEAYADGLHDLAFWLSELGADFEPLAPLPPTFPAWPHFPGGSSVRYSVVTGGSGRRGEELWKRLESAVGRRGIAVRTGTEVDGLLVEDDVVVGVECGSQSFRAASGVVLACGGFEANPVLVESYLPFPVAAPAGHGRNTGTGIRMGQSVGAEPWHMYGSFGWFAHVSSEFASPFPIRLPRHGHLMVDANGHRFCDETGFEVHDQLRALTTYLPGRPNRPRLPAWVIFDEGTRRAGPLSGSLGSPNEYRWSWDNSAEVERGWILEATTVKELAALMGTDGDVLGRTIAAYEAATQEKVDPAFGRAPDTLLPLDKSRLYAIEVWPSLGSTTGGPRHDADARVLRSRHEVVDGLFAAGAVSSVWNHLIDHGGGLTDALVFGRIAGTAAARRNSEGSSRGPALGT
ncbi:FAD-dependent oxidoreductase [Amycolatopsis pigmentata]|uniref:FAD-dependent oxidoreductase n=1 Tax=Amycolatopsis pigmentata TaxID=450801 RepID=A0ABW5FM30_9PSEU